jgi:hypothetical protein
VACGKLTVHENLSTNSTFINLFGGLGSNGVNYHVTLKADTEPVWKKLPASQYILNSRMLADREQGYNEAIYFPDQ